MSGLDEYRQDAKNRYNLALQEYTKACMGRPLEKSAVKHGLESLCKKVEKHLSEEENLFPVVWRSIQTEFITQCLRFSNLIQQCYPESGISLEFTVTDLQNYFTEIARSR
uniref:SJCHGC08527 protein n=1 Tax=Schistosoma japonicum TaxID=6182 RepID=Q5DG27_SCHJA|nr:SJCHGC08527 protein [Schistosoma japonicum]